MDKSAKTENSVEDIVYLFHLSRLQAQPQVSSEYVGTSEKSSPAESAAEIPETKEDKYTSTNNDTVFNKTPEVRKNPTTELAIVVNSKEEVVVEEIIEEVEEVINIIN